MKVVYTSFEGRYSDNPRALYEMLRERRPDVQHVWLVDPVHAGGFPADVPAVGYGGPESRRELETADVVISNTHIDLDWDKAPGTLYLQTWHGTPLKRVHFDVLWAPEGRLARLNQDIARWDVLLSPNAISTPRLRRAFGFTGDVAETGYPRNDLLSSPDRDQVRRRVRRELGIPERSTAVFYAPTWRDDVVFGGGTDVITPQLDPAAFTRRLGGDHVLMLRAHYMLTGRLDSLADPAVRDVSFYPDINELYLAADVLVTDYSSTMFDFAVTGKPLLFFTYDLDRYRDSIRGFYFDPAGDPPGPMLHTGDALLGALSDLPAVQTGYRQAYTRFQQRFSHLEDGHATERVVERFLLPALTGRAPQSASASPGAGLL